MMCLNQRPGLEASRTDLALNCADDFSCARPLLPAFRLQPMNLLAALVANPSAAVLSSVAALSYAALAWAHPA
jgi:hypothetical protein